MEITDVRIRIIENAGKLKATVCMTIGHSFVVHDIKVIEGREGLFVVMPSKKTPNGAFVDVAHPINRETRDVIQTAILDKYESIVNVAE